MNQEQEFDRITVALICYDEKKQLAFVLEDIKKQSYFKYIKEVLLLQNAHHKKGTCQETKQIAENFKKKLPLVFLSSTKNHLGLARSKLMKRASSKWVAWTDSDCRLPENWLESLVENTKQAQKITDKTVAVGGPNRLPEDRFWKKMINLSLDFPIGHGFSPQAWIPCKVRSVSHIPTTNGLFLKPSLLSAGNFSAWLPFAGEDLEMGKRLKSQGKKLFLFPSPLIINGYALSYLKSLKRLFFFGSAQNENKGLLFYFGLFFFPLCVLSLLLSAFWFLNGAGGLALVFKSPLPSLLAGIFLSCYFALLIGYSLKACLKTKKLSPLCLTFFWLAKHIVYSAGVCFGLFILPFFSLSQSPRESFLEEF